MKAPENPSEALLQVRGLRTWFNTDRGLFKAVDGISFDVGRGRTVGLVGESGCGKSVTSLSLMGLVAEPGEVNADQIIFEGQDILGLSPQARRLLRGNRMSMVFQEPMTSLRCSSWFVSHPPRKGSTIFPIICRVGSVSA